MDASLRNTPGLIGLCPFYTVRNHTYLQTLAKIERHRDELIKHFEALVGRAGV